VRSPVTPDLASISDRIQAEVLRAIQRSIKGVEYFSTSGPTLGSTPKDVLQPRHHAALSPPPALG
jgi:polyhydroxyalkanoate synthase